MWTEFSKKVVAGAFVPVLAAGLVPITAFALDDVRDVETLQAAEIAMEETADASEELAVQAEGAGTFTFSNDGISASEDASGYETSIDKETRAQVLTINSAGTYVITGSCSNGKVAVKKGVSGVNLVLKDLTLATDADKAIKFKAGASGTIEIQGTSTLSTTNDKGIIKANAEADDEDNIIYADDGTTSGGDLTITGDGTLNLSSSYQAVVDGETEGCDAINCEGDLTVLSGTLNIDVSDDGLHADNTLSIGAADTSGPTINVASSTEGFEGASVNLISGSGAIVSTDDGVNAANADLETYSWPYFINIEGGAWTVNAEGDGLDSNGDITVSGGNTIVYGSTNGGNGVFDIGDTQGCVFTVSGGTLFGLGTSDMAITPTSGTYVVFGNGGMNMGGNMGPGGMGGNMGPGGSETSKPDMSAMSENAAENESNLSEQAGRGGDPFGSNTGGSSYSITAGQTITVQDSSGGILATTTAAKNAQWVLYASSDLEEGQTYTLNAGNSQIATAVATSGSSTGGNPGGQPPQGASDQAPATEDPSGTEGSEDASQEAGEQTTSGQMFRLYNPYSGEHFYTANASEKENAIADGWVDEGVGWTAPESGNPVYRLYNSYAGDHHYTLNATERDELVAAGWTYEGVGWYSAGEDGVPVYREYNPNMFSCNHNYTTDKDEHDGLVAIGWTDEEIAWYGI